MNYCGVSALLPVVDIPYWANSVQWCIESQVHAGCARSCSKPPSSGASGKQLSHWWRLQVFLMSTFYVNVKEWSTPFLDTHRWGYSQKLTSTSKCWRRRQMLTLTLPLENPFTRCGSQRPLRQPGDDASRDDKHRRVT